MHRTFPRRCASFVPSRFLDHKEYVMMKANLTAKKAPLGPLDSAALYLLSSDVKIDSGILQLNALALDCHKSTHQSQSGVKELMEKQKIKKDALPSEMQKRSNLILCLSAHVLMWKAMP